jgi:uncharacterized protein (TIGR03083 family)
MVAPVDAVAVTSGRIRMGDADARTWELARAERVDILAFLQTLTPEEWVAPSLCSGWRVRDVVAHQLIDETVRELGTAQVLARLAWWRFDIHRANAWWVQHCADRPVSELVDAWDRSLRQDPHLLVRWLPGPEGFFRGAVIHHQDIRRPLRHPRTIPPDRLRAVLDLVLTKDGSGNLGSLERAEGLLLQATDLDWSHGQGPAVRGPAEALLMTVAGRADAMPELEGDGLRLLAARMPHQ